MKNLLFLIVLALLSACRVDTRKESLKLRIVCSTSVIRDCIQQIAGDSVEVVSLMGPGIDPHSYKARPSDIVTLNNASVIIYNGLHLEGKMVEIFEKLSERKKVFAVSEGISPNQLIVTDPRAGTVDPHIWFDTKIWLEGLAGVVEELCRQFPDRAEAFRSNFKIFSARTQKLAEALRNDLSVIPEQQRVLITSHDAFHYFSRDFNIQVRALQGISTTQEPGVRDVVDLVDFIVERRVKAIFVEHSVSPKAISSVIESCRKKGWNVSIGGTLYSDALGDENSSGSTYQAMLRHNVESIINGLKTN